jgi:hypothetical protein
MFGISGLTEKLLAYYRRPYSIEWVKRFKILYVRLFSSINPLSISVGVLNSRTDDR